MPDELMRARHAELNVVHLVPDNDYYRSNGWQPVDESVPTTAEEQSAAEAAAFSEALAAGRPADAEMQIGDDPADFKVEQVAAYLASADDAERVRVLDAERDGKGRKSLLEG